MPGSVQAGKFDCACKSSAFKHKRHIAQADHDEHQGECPGVGSFALWL
jgi:hypothetical protein